MPDGIGSQYFFWRSDETIYERMKTPTKNKTKTNNKKP